MPRLTASRIAENRGHPAAAPRRGGKKTAAMQDRLTARALFFRRVRRGVKPGLWIFAALGVLVIGQKLYRQIPAIGPVLSPAGSLRHDFAALAGAVGLRITEVRIDGADTTPAPVIAAALGVKAGDPILGFSLGNAQARIERLGPIQTAVVARLLPGTVIVTVTERAPYAVWQTAGGINGQPKFVVIDKAGNIIADQDAMAAKRRNPALLLLTGADAPQQASALIGALVAAPTLRAHVVAAQRIDRLRWNLILRNDTVVKLPEENAQQAIAELGQLQTGIALLDRPVEVIDLRLPGRVVVRPYPAAAAAVPPHAAHS